MCLEIKVTWPRQQVVEILFFEMLTTQYCQFCTKSCVRTFLVVSISRKKLSNFDKILTPF